ncbi:hypothetical protein [Streptomyces bikiniensis]|uniref:hypothetical protein n=1 Tax=Streptomyces bikiniensis TaxID=1896 RepID=UPI00052773D5|nr:hypothetical protein [Streptomyces bikiniensis]
MTILLAVLVGLLLCGLYPCVIVPDLADRWVRKHFVASDYGLAPRGQLDSSRPGPPPPPHRHREGQAVADAAWNGDWRVAEAYVRAAGEDWDERWSRTELLQEVAREEDAWLEAWRAAEPGNCDAATLRARIMVQRAWAVRGGGFAHEVSKDRMKSFRAMLPAAIEEARRAALLDPANPGPWVVMVTAARGAQYGRARFRPLWDGLVARAPHHYEGHWQALQYWCAKWYGSDRLMMRFAGRAVREAPQGSPLAGMYLHALEELVGRPATAFSSTPLVRGHLKRVAASFAEVDPADERLPALRHLLAHYMLRSRMYGPALEQFRLIDPWCGAEPWRREGGPKAAFETARGRAVKLSRASATGTVRSHGTAR